MSITVDVFAALKKPSLLPPLTQAEREAFIAWRVRDWMRDCVLASPSERDATAYMLWQWDNGSITGPTGWQCEIPKRGQINAVLSVPGPDAVPNRYGVLLGEPVRAGTFTFAEMVHMVRERTASSRQLAFALEVPA